MSAFDTPFVVNMYGEVFHITLYKDGPNYAMDNSPVIKALCEDGSPFAVLTVCIPGTKLGSGEFLIKTWSENEQLASAVMALGDFEDTGRRVKSGFVEAQVWKLKE